ncbi:MAG TPA: hypothetical protein VG496_01995 [Myxococcales bacterium]|nr:hypothetical protein [Myxococcales bacterium]
MSEPGWRSWAGAHRVDLLLFGFTLFAYALSSGSLLAHQSQAPHFVWQADAFLHGRLDVARPPNLNDWVFERGRWYVSFPPFPAVLMMPFVAAAGLDLNDVTFTLPFAAANVSLLYLLLRRIQRVEGGTRSEWDHAVFALLFGFGTLAWSCSIRGEVWFTAEVVGVTLTLLYLHAALRGQHPFWAGIALACGTITRAPILFSAVFFLLEAVSEGGGLESRNLRLAFRDPHRKKEIAKRLALFAAPIAAIAIPVAWMNDARFGNPFEFGHSQLYANRVNADIRAYGLFSFHYLPRNVRSAFLLLPRIQLHPLRLDYDPNGMSLFVTTPLFALLFFPRRRPRLWTPLWLAAAAVAMPGFFYQNNGWQQFGFRFSLDYTPYLVLLLAISGRALDGLFWLLAAAGVAVNAWGAAVFNRP